jgi:hypothetical protein
MASIRLATAANVQRFQNLSHALREFDHKWSELIDYDGLQDEIGRFRVWSGNLGALQKGHSSLDYRLRDSPLLSTNALKFLKELEDNVSEACAVVSGDRLPYELQPKSEKAEEEDDNDDGFFDEDDDDEDDEEGESRTELSMRFAEIVDIIDNLYKLSVRIRTPTIRSRSLKAATYKPKDPETGIDILETYAAFDLQHTEELLRHLRHPHQEEVPSSDYDYLITRLSAAITLRRRQFKYWRRRKSLRFLPSLPLNVPWHYLLVPSLLASPFYDNISHHVKATWSVLIRPQTATSSAFPRSQKSQQFTTVTRWTDPILPSAMILPKRSLMFRWSYITRKSPVRRPVGRCSQEPKPPNIINLWTS